MAQDYCIEPLQQYIPIEDVKNSDLCPEDLNVLITTLIDERGLIQSSLDAYNNLLETGLSKILMQCFQTKDIIKNTRTQPDTESPIMTYELKLSFSNIQIESPQYPVYSTGIIKPLYPYVARRTGRAYAGQMSLDTKVQIKAFFKDGRVEEKEVDVLAVRLAQLPIMIGSKYCHLYQQTRTALKYLNEDPNEPGGYFLAKGSEWSIDLLENISFNKLHLHKGAINEQIRGEYISQPEGAYENSSQLIIRLMASGALTIEINSTKFSKTCFPFYIIFRLLGLTSDKKICEHIVYDLESQLPVSHRMKTILERAFLHHDPAFTNQTLDLEDLVDSLAAQMSNYVTDFATYKTNINAQQYLNNNFCETFDRVLLPHLGRTPTARHTKIRVLGILIHNTLLAHLGVLKTTDRDSYSNKRTHGAAQSFAKTFKTQFNLSCLTPLRKRLKRRFELFPFHQLTPASISETVKHVMASCELGRTIEQSITSGEKTITINRRQLVNRISPQMLERKNQVNVYSALRTVSTHNASRAAKLTDRSDKMRRVNTSQIGYICCAKSADTGEMVGMKKELAITASVCTTGDITPLLLHLQSDPSIILADHVATQDFIQKNYGFIFVDGIWVGCCTKSYELVRRYRLLRREGRIVDPFTSIVWDSFTDTIEFLLDAGRLTRPLLIVDNNIERYDTACRANAKIPFYQNIRLTLGHIRGLQSETHTFNALCQEGLIEWITPQEAENCLIAPNLALLRERVADVTHQYTHCEIEPAIFGLTALISPFCNHTQPARVTYETNQGRQAAGWYTMATHRSDKNRFFQHYIERPLVETITSKWVPPNGMNAIVAYMSYDGFNQEDSAVVSKAYIERGGFAGQFYRFEKVELDKGQSFETPDRDKTINLKPSASYEKLKNGIVPQGTIVYKGDVLIGRTAKITENEPQGGALSIDRSLIYHQSEPALVTSSYKERGPNDNEFAVVNMCSYRPLGVGDKISSRAGNKSIVGYVRPESDLPYDKYGVTPDLIINPHCLAGSTLVCQPSGASKRLDSFTSQEFVWGWGTQGLRPITQSRLLSRPTPQQLYKYYLCDGRSIRATASHPIWAKTQTRPLSWVRAEELDRGHLIAMGPEGPEPIISDCSWSYLEWNLTSRLAPTLAFARLLGRLVSDASTMISTTIDCECGLDYLSIMADIATVGGTAQFYPYLTRGGLLQLTGGLQQKVLTYYNENGWFDMLEHAPAAVKCEFLGGLCGGKAGIAPILNYVQNEWELQNLYILLPTHRGLSPLELKSSYQRGQSLNKMLDSFVNTDLQLAAGNTIHPMPPTPSFGTRIGVRHCARKMALVSAATAYYRIKQFGCMCPYAFFTTAECVRWFSSKTPLIVDHTLPIYFLPYTGSHVDVIDYVYDLTIPDVHNYVANGLVVHNSKPSRMTIGQIIEASLSALCQHDGVTTDGSAFRQVNVGEINSKLSERGLRASGKSCLYHGCTGEYNDAAIFMCPTFYQRLLKFVRDDEYAVGGQGPTDPLTGQPTEGKNKQGGMRDGEMEQWTKSAQSTAFSIMEKMFLDSDGRKGYICTSCGDSAIYNHYYNIYKCPRCKEGATIREIDTSHSSSILRTEIRASNIKMNIKVTPYEFDTDAG